MKKIECKYMDIFISKDLFDSLTNNLSFVRQSYGEDDIVSDLEGKVVHVISNEESFKRYIGIYSRLNAIGRVAALYAEKDCTVRGEPAYLDGKRIKRIQGWINKNDGKYGCLVILWNDSSDGPCDDVKSKKSLVLMESGASLCLFSPTAKEVIDAYTIDYHLKQLRKHVRANANS